MSEVAVRPHFWIHTNCILVLGEMGNNNLIVPTGAWGPERVRQVSEVTQLASNRARTRTNLQSKPVSYTSLVNAYQDGLGFESTITTILLTTCSFLVLLKLSLSPTLKTLYGILLYLCLLFLFLPLTPSGTTHFMEVPQHSILFLLFMLKARTT